MASMKFTVKINGAIAAMHMSLEMTCLLLEAIFDKYYQQAERGGIEVTIKSEPLDEKVTE